MTDAVKFTVTLYPKKILFWNDPAHPRHTEPRENWPERGEHYWVKWRDTITLMQLAVYQGLPEWSLIGTTRRVRFEDVAVVQHVPRPTP